MAKNTEIDDLIAAGVLVFVAASGVYLVLKAFGCFEEGEEVTKEKIQLMSRQNENDKQNEDGEKKRTQDIQVPQCVSCGNESTTHCIWCGDHLCDDHVFAGGYCLACTYD